MANLSNNQESFKFIDKLRKVIELTLSEDDFENDCTSIYCIPKSIIDENRIILSLAQSKIWLHKTIKKSI